MSIVNENGTIKEYYSWNDYQADIFLLAKKVQKLKRGALKNIYGIPRGGLVVAVSLSHELDLPLILSREDITAETLIVDDIADTGATLEAICKQIRHKPKVVTIYYHPQSAILPDIYARKKERWIVFPWETENSSKYDGTAS